MNEPRLDVGGEGLAGGSTDDEPGPRAQTVELINPYLGLRPFVLIELGAEDTGPDDDDDDDDFDITLTIRFGGGVGRSGAMGVLATTLEEHGWTCTPPDGFDADAED